MPERTDRMFSLSKGIREVIEKGELTGTEREAHFALERAAESDGNEFRWLRGGNERDLTLNVPVELFTRQITTAGFPIGIQTAGISNLQTWSACLRAGATVLSGLSRNATVWSIGTLPTPQWLPEIGQVAPSDAGFVGVNVNPKRISAMLVVSRQLLVQSGPELDRILINDLSWQLASYLDQVALFGTGSPQPLGLTGIAEVHQGVAIDSANLHPSFCAVEELVETANVSMDSYGVIVSPGTKQILRSAPSFTGGSITTWAEIRGAQSSPEVTDGRAFAGCWNNMTFCLWGRGVELLIDQVTMALTGQVKITRVCFAMSAFDIRRVSRLLRRLQVRHKEFLLQRCKACRSRDSLPAGGFLLLFVLDFDRPLDLTCDFAGVLGQNCGRRERAKIFVLTCPRVPCER
jgi:Phage capsid family